MDNGNNVNYNNNFNYNNNDMYNSNNNMNNVNNTNSNNKNNPISKIILAALGIVAVYFGLVYFKVIDDPLGFISSEKDVISFSVKKIEIRKGDVTHLDINNENEESVIFTSSNPDVATINETTGYITALKAGVTTITVRSRQNSNIKDECDITVIEPVSTIDVDSISLNKQSLNMNVGDTQTLYYSLSPNNASAKKIVWSTSDNNVATISKYGEISAVGEGEAVIKIKTYNGKEAACNVTVTKRKSSDGKKTSPKEKTSPEGTSPKGENVEVTNISFESNSVNLKIGSKYNLRSRMTIKPSEATNKNITWTSSNTSVATVSNGVVTALKAGTVTITAKSNNGKTATCTFVVKSSGGTTTDTAIAGDGTINNSHFNITEGNNVNKNTALANTKGINEAIAYANKNGIKNIKLKKGTYVVANVVNKDDGILNAAIQLKSNINFNLNGSTIKMYPNSDAQYNIILVYDKKNVKVYNGILYGDREKHTCGNGKTTILSEDKRVGPDARNKKKCNDGSKGDGTHEWGMGVRVRNSSSVEIYNLTIKEMTGDGVNVGNTKSGVPITTKNVLVHNNEIYNCRRQGITVARVDGLKIYSNNIHNIKGANPQAGIDFEPDGTTNFIIKAEVYKNKFSQISGNDISSYNKLQRCTTKEEVNIIIRDNSFECKGTNVVLRTTIKNNVKLSKNTCAKVSSSGDVKC